MRIPTVKHLLAWALVALLLTLSVRAHAAAAAYNLPGTWDTTTATYPNGDPRNGLHQVARDSNGYWYVVWENSSQTDIMMAYTTTSTPTAATHWGLVTLVDNGATGVITANPANNTSGSYPSLCIGLDDALHFVWKASDSTTYYTRCSDLANLGTAANWITPIKVSTNCTDYSFALDYKGAAHLAGRGVNSKQVVYTKYDTATNAWLA